MVVLCSLGMRESDCFRTLYMGKHWEPSKFKFVGSRCRTKNHIYWLLLWDSFIKLHLGQNSSDCFGVSFKTQGHFDFTHLYSCILVFSLTFDSWVENCETSHNMQKLKLQSIIVTLLCACFWAFELQRQSGTVATETFWPVKPKMFIFWPFMEKVCLPLLQKWKHCR